MDNKSPDDSRGAESAALAARAREGSRAAFAGLVELYQEDIYRLLYYRLQNREEAEDLWQEVFVTAFRRIDQLADPCRVRAWLVSISLNRLRDHCRRRGVRNLFGLLADRHAEFPAGVLPAGPPGPEDNLGRRQFWRQVNLLLARLSRMEREVFTLRFLDQMLISEIADALNKNENTVKTHLYRAVAKIRKQATALEL